MNPILLAFTLASFFIGGAAALAEHGSIQTGTPGRTVAPDLHFTEVRVDSGEMIRLSQLSLKELIATLRRDYGLVVLSIDEWGPSEKKEDPDAEATRQKAYRFYWNEEENRKTWARVDGMFIQPHSGFNMEAQTESDFVERPYSDKPLILIDSGSSTHTVLHEFMHFLIWKSAKQELKTLNEKPLALTYWHRIQRNRAKAEITSLSKVEMATATPEQKQRHLQEKSRAELKAVFHSYIFSKSLLEELDITRWMYENAERIGSDEEAKNHDLLYHQKTLKDFIKIHEATATLMTSANGTVLIKSNGEEGRKTARDLQDAQNSVVPKLANDVDWFNAIAREQAESQKK